MHTRKRILITGAAGFIGNELALRLVARGDEVVGVDNLNDYYEVSLKEARLQRLQHNPHFTFKILDISDRAWMSQLVSEYAFDLRAQIFIRTTCCT